MTNARCEMIKSNATDPLSPIILQSCICHSYLPPHRPVDVAFGVAFFHRLAFVVLLLAVADAEQHLGPAFFEVHFERHEREAFFEGLAGEFLDLAAVHEQLAAALGLVVQRVRDRCTR